MQSKASFDALWENGNCEVENRGKEKDGKKYNDHWQNTNEDGNGGKVDTTGGLGWPWREDEDDDGAGSLNLGWPWREDEDGDGTRSLDLGWPWSEDEDEEGFRGLEDE